jgi:hypothetical protein
MIINHNLLFFFGFCYYILAPLIFIEGLELQAFSMIPRLDSQAVGWVVSFSISTLFFWYLGQVFKVRYFYFSRKLSQVAGSSTSVLLVFVISVLMFLYGLSVYGIRTSGYTHIDFKYSGFVAGFTYLFMVLLLFSWQSPLLKLVVGVFYVAGCVLLLFVGSRLYVLSSLIALVIFYSRFGFERINFKILLVLMLILTFLLGVGVVRSGGFENISFSKMLFVLGAEPFFTWWSVTLYPFDPVEVMLPEVGGLLSLFINVIPSFVFPNKADYIVSQAVLGGYSAPLGASNVIVSALVFFGLPIWCLFVFAYSNFIAFLKRDATDFFLARCLYAIVCSFLPFFFFREIYQIQFKLFLTFFLIVPVSLVLVRWLFRCLKKI